MSNDSRRTSGYLPVPTRKMGDILLREKMVSPEQLQNATEQAQRTGEHLHDALASLGYVDGTQLVDFLSRQYQVPSIDLPTVDIAEEIVRLVPREVCERHDMIPVALHGSTLVIAMVDPGNYHAVDDIKFLTGLNIEVVVSPAEDIHKTRERFYGAADQLALLDDMNEQIEFLQEEDEFDAEEARSDSEEAPVVRLVNLILVDAIRRKASDIHVECYEKSFRVRYRMDGVLHEIMRPPMKLKNAIISRLKIMSQLDIAERRLPQDGRIKLKMADGKECDFRVSVLPTLFGEKVVLRLLDKSNLQLDMTKLGFDAEELAKFKKAIHQPFGMVLVTGPTGSGKTTTLYSALADLNKVGENLSTAEDPVEFNLDGINQVQMHEGIGLNFASVLRSFLRQDPDIILVGEIRDFETAEIAIKAALTGHLVLSTLHTNSAPATINRLLNMGVEPFMVTASLNLIAAQRLARRLCKECKEPFTYEKQACIDAGMTEEEYDAAAKDGMMKGMGCRVCGDTGYKGRVAFYEIMPISDAIKEAVLQGYSATELKRVAVEDGMPTLRRAGLAKVRQGLTSLDEVIRCTRADFK
ncbi:MAG TPA: type IV-A pilus assembly ATPase PilB [Myxococcales bacterium]|mgnify:CR=1 FL=1|nr:type IV-A pilus assembly ATPase PilB [Myxococcales bacterium]